MNWDKYYFDICNTVATNSKCFSRKLGAILVIDKSIISTGYNGPPRGVPHCGHRYHLDKYYQEKLGHGKYSENVLKTTCPRQVLGYKSGEGLDLCPAGHAERNALINAARHGIATKDSVLYLNTGIPCSSCMVEIINAGVVEVVVTEYKFYDRLTEYITTQAAIKIREFSIG